MDDDVAEVSNIDEPAPVVRENSDVHEGEETKARPWTRFFARWMDYIFFSLFLGIVAGLARLPFVETSILISSLFIFFFWTFFEAFFLCMWGTTPGKAILGISLGKQDGKRLTYGEALNRAFSVWLLGMGAGLPLIMLITWIVACVKLSNMKITSWDRRGNIVLHHKNLTWYRIAITLLVFIGSFLLGWYHGWPR